MYLVDTSVWVHALRPGSSPAIQSLLRPLIAGGDMALTEWIILELMTGLRSSERKDALLSWLAPVTRLPFDPAWWPKAWSCAASLRRKGVSCNAADCLIATVAMEHRVPLVHCDGDFEDIRRHTSLATLDWRGHARP